MDAPHARVAELAAGALHRALQQAAVLELGHHAVRRRLRVAVAGRGDRQLGAHHQRMRELALGAHRRLRDRAAVRRDEVHQPERQRFQPRMRGQQLDVAQRAVGLHQRVQRNLAREPHRARGHVHGMDGGLEVGGVARLGNHEVGQARAGVAQQHLQHALELRMAVRHDAGAHAVELVGRRLHQLGDEVGVLHLAAHRRAVLAVQRDVEHRAQLGLQGQALAHARLDARVVVADRQRGGRVAVLEQDVARMGGGGHRRGSSKWKTRGRGRAFRIA